MGFNVIFSQQSTGGDDFLDSDWLACLDCSKGSFQLKLYDVPLRFPSVFFPPICTSGEGPTFLGPGANLCPSLVPTVPPRLTSLPSLENPRQQNQEAICKLGRLAGWLAGDGTTSRENKHATSSLTYFSKRQRNSSPGMEAVLVPSSPPTAPPPTK